jgi:hypothetical protein
MMLDFILWGQREKRRWGWELCVVISMVVLFLSACTTSHLTNQAANLQPVTLGPRAQGQVLET